PIHLIFFNRFDQRLLLDALSRHFTTILEATPLYDFVTQLASFDSPIVTFLDEEIRELKNFPMVCQSLQAVAAFLGFDWNEGVKYREIFRARMFDFWRKLDEPPPGETPWYTSRARFNSQIPLEYAYAAWDQLPIAEQAKRDDFASYRGTTRENLEGFHERRLEALEHVAKDFAGNKYTAKSSFDLPDLSVFEGMAHTLAQAIDEFVTVERHVELADWKSRRLLAPERRVLAGDALIVRYLEEDQDPGAAERNRENACRKDIRDRIVAEWRAEHPDERLKLTKEQNAECKWSQEGMIFRLRLECAGVDCDLDEILRLTTFREGDYLCLFERWTVDSRLPEAERKPFQPTPKQLLYAMRVTLKRVVAERNASGGAVRAFAEVEMGGQRGGTSDRGFTFGTINERPLDPGELYTLDSDPNDWYGFFCAKVTEELCGLEASSPGAHNAVYDRLAGPRSVRVSWPPQAEAAQLRFLDGLDALQRTGVLHPFDDRQRAYIAEYGAEATLLVQGPPGTGKSYTTAYALLARLQGAFSAGLDYRVIVSAKTHAATDVLLKKLVEVRHLLLEMRCKHPEIFSQHFDEHVLSVPLFRAAPKSKLPDGVRALPKKEDRAPGEPLALDAIRVEPHCIVAATPGGVYRMLKDKGGSLFGRELCDCLVLDEASQMNLPEAIMTSLPLKREARLIVVGDHRQMPPIVKHDWSKEPRRTFQEFRSYESLFLALLPLAPPMVKLAESFRLHADMAEFLRAEVYAQDGIPYFSRKREKLLPSEQADPFVASVLAAEHTIVVIVHNEDGSMLRNPFEQRLITPVLEALAGQPYHLDPRHGLGVVVPHRAQRAALQEAVPCLSTLDPTTGTISLSAVDTVERFQGDERDAIMVSATESDRDYLLLSSDFLLDPRRLTVALSRAKHKMILVASRSVFNLFSSDEETFANSQLWKKLLRKWCTVKVWEGERDGKWVEVWGNGQTLKDELSTNAVDVAARERAVEWAEGLLDQR
ncbi:MAG: DNA helicase, partial [Chloroflexi bacterium]